MTAKVLDGRIVAAAVDERTAATAARLAASGVVPGLAVVLVGDDPASATYVRMKERACERLGIRSFDSRMPASTGQGELIEVVSRFNADPSVHGILPQLPLPSHLDAEALIAAVSPEKDVDGIHQVNLGRLVRGLPAPRACTPAGCMEILRHYGIDPKGKRVVVVGRSTLVGKPMALLLLEAHATVTIAHSRTADLPALCREADILVAAVGRRHMVTREYVKPGAVVIDVGTNRDEAGKLCGDVAFDEVAEIASAITPSPGGVGPMTIAMLMANTVAAAERAAGLAPTRRD